MKRSTSRSSRPAVVDDLATKGKIVAGSRIDLAKVGMGVAVKEGAAAPDIGSVDAFKRMLLAAKSVAYIDPKAGGSSGIYFDKLLDRLGIGDQVRPKAKLKQGGYVAELVASGEAEVAIHQISEIVPVKGATSWPAHCPPRYRISPPTRQASAPPPRTARPPRPWLRFSPGLRSIPILKSKGMQKP